MFYGRQLKRTDHHRSSEPGAGHVLDGVSRASIAVLSNALRWLSSGRAGCRCRRCCDLWRKVTAARTGTLIDDRNGPPRVIHVVASLDKASVEVWLLRMLGYAARIDVPVDWTLLHGRRGNLDTARARSARRLLSTSSDRSEARVPVLLPFAAGVYDVLHSHHDLVSAVYLLAAFGCPSSAG